MPLVLLASFLIDAAAIGGWGRLPRPDSKLPLHA